MKFYMMIPALLICLSNSAAHGQQCRFEKSNGTETATYFEAINWYKELDKISPLAASCQKRIC